MDIVMARPVFRAFGLVCVTLGGVACNTGTEPRPSHPVAFHLAVDANAPQATAAGAGALEITGVRLVVGAAALGSGDEYGCVDCEGDEESSQGQQLVDVPLDGSSVLVATEQVTAGTYSNVEISLEAPTTVTLAAEPAWPGRATIQIAGRFNGTPFVLPLGVDGSFREALSVPVTVAAGATPDPIAVRVTLPVASWFVSNGSTLDPAVADQRARIEANARAAIQLPESGGGEK